MKKLLFTLLAVMVTLAINAEQVSKQKALQKAQQFMPGKNFTVASSRSLARGDNSQAGEESLYIMNADGGGFVIVSGDDRTEPILGYSDKGEFRTDNMPDNVRYWIESYVEQIKALNDGGATPVVRTRTGSAQPAIEPLIKTHWDQVAPYNLKCPKVDNYNCLTGCVATALAQMMYYYRCPETSTAIPYYTTKKNGIYMKALPATTFKWDLMKSEYSSKETGDAVDAVAELMLYVGQSCEMNYDAGNSGAVASIEAMVNYFGYSKNMQSISRASYPVSQWEGVIYDELKEGRPVLYEGFSSTSGHEFICDGYDGNGLFHINWGWGGHGDGFFVLSLANPDEKGAGGGTDNKGYVQMQGAIIGFQPAAVDEKEFPIVYYSDIPTTFSAQYTRSSNNQDFEDVELSFPVEVYYKFVPTTTCTLDVGWALFKHGEQLSVLTSTTVEIDNRDISVYRTNSYQVSSTASFGAGLTDGDYTIINVYKMQGDEEWRLVNSPSTGYIVASIEGNTLSLRGATDRNNSYKFNEVTYTGDMGVGDEIYAAVNLTNTGDAMQEHVFIGIERNGTWELLGWGYSSVEPGETGIVNCSFTPTVASTLELKFCTDREGKNVIGTSQLTIYESEEVTVNEIKYKCNIGSGTAKVTGCTFETVVSDGIEVVIPSQIKSPNTGKTYLVKKIAERAINDPYWIRKLTIEEGIEEIEDIAFFSSYQLEELSLPSTLKSIGSNVFMNSERLKTVICHMVNPCSVGSGTFTYSEYKYAGAEEITHFSNATLYVPVGSKLAYTQANTWKNFSPIYAGEPGELTHNGITYQYITGEDFATVIKGDEETLKDKDVTILSKVTAGGKDYSVKYIADDAFPSITMNSLTIERGIEEIGKNAFRYSRMGGTIVIPEGVKTIDEGAFRSCGLNQIDLPSTLTAIEDNAFAYNSDLAIVVTRMETPCTVGENAFTVSKWVDGVSTEFFTSATLCVPVNSKTTYAQAEVWKNFSPIYAGEPEELTQGGITYRCITGEGIAIVIKGDDEILKGQDVTIPSKISVDEKDYSVKCIADEAFSSISMKSLTIEPGVEEIGMRAFVYSSMGGILVIPEGVKTIGKEAFRSCELDWIDLPSTLTTIGNNAFAYNSYLATVVVRMETPCTVAENAFIVYKWVDGENTETFTSATLCVPVDSKLAYAQADTWKNFSPIYAGEPRDLTQGGITYRYITGEGFATVIKGDAETLRGQDVTIPSEISADKKNYSVKNIAEDAFYNVQMKSLTIEPGVEEIGMRAFRSSSMGGILVIAEGVKTIREEAFRSCGLNQIDLPSTLTTIGNNAFAYNSYLATVVVRMETPCTVAENAFSVSKRVDNQYVEAFTSATLYVPVDSKTAYAQADTWKNFSPIYAGEPKELVQEGITYYYITGEGFATVTKGDAETLKGQDVTIPSKISVDEKDYSVKCITDEAFYSISMKSLTIEPGVEEISTRAFIYSSMGGTIIIPEGVKTIGEEAFQSCGLILIDLPSTLTTIGDYAFAYNSYLETVVTRMKVPCTVGENAFNFTKWVDNQSTQSFTAATLYVPADSKKTYSQAEVWKNFSPIYAGEPKELTQGGITYQYITGEGFATVIKGDREVLKDQDVTIPSKITADKKDYSVKYIAEGAFHGFSIKSLTIEPGVEEIGMRAFKYSSMSGTIVIPEGVKTIGECAFESCGLKRIDLPSTLTAIGDNAFIYNSLATVVAHMETPCTVSENAFTITKWVDNQSTESFTSATLYVPVNSKKAYAQAEVWKNFSPIYAGEPGELTQDGITYHYITGEGFATVTEGDADALKDKDVTIPSVIEADGVTYPVKEIEDYAFRYVYMNSLTIKPGVEIIGNGAFSNSYNLKKIVLPEGVKYIGEGAFLSCGLNQIDLPSTLMTIGDKAFAYNRNLETVVTRMEAPCAVGENAFTDSKWMDGAWKDVFTAAKLYVPSGTKDAYKKAPVWKNFSATVVLGDADGNGYVQQKDIDAIVNHLMGNTPDGFDEKGADANLDDKINAADIVTVVNMLKQ